jgi:hypothetical protein
MQPINILPNKKAKTSASKAKPSSVVFYQRHAVINTIMLVAYDAAQRH